MRASLQLLVLIPVASGLLVSCAGKTLRLPSSQPAVHYDAAKVALLKEAAENSVFLQISSEALRDVPQRQIGERCRKIGEPEWHDRYFDILRVLSTERAFDRVHVIEIKRGDVADVEVSKDLDGLTYLNVLYAKTESRQVAEQLSDIPCADQGLDFLGRDVVSTRYDWPRRERIAAVLRELPERPRVERLSADPRFGVFLAEQMTVFRLTPEISFEKNPSGQSLIVSSFKSLGDQLAEPKQLAHVRYWMREITLRSKLGQSLKFFGLKKDSALGHGIQVDAPGEFARKMDGLFPSPTYLYLSYRTRNNDFNLTGMSDLDACLEKLTDIHRSPVSSMTAYDQDPASFLYPGHHCQPAAGSEGD